MEKILTHSIRAICVSGMAWGMTTAMAQDASLLLQPVEPVNGERLVVVAYSDPESEVGNGTNPPRRETNSETEAGNDLDMPMEVDNFPKGEVGNGTFPPNVNPMMQQASVLLQHVETVDGERLIVFSHRDPETEVGNGTNPPDPNFIDPDPESSSDFAPRMDTQDIAESEIGNHPL